jgi:hypothetical protein
MKSDAELDHRCNPYIARDKQMAARRSMRGRNEFQESALAGAITPHEPDGFTALDLERHTLQGPELLHAFAPLRVQQAKETYLQLH